MTSMTTELQSHKVKRLKRAGATTLARITPLLEDLRNYPMLNEERPGVFYLDSQEFLHFHVHPDGVVADARLTKGFVRLPVTSRSEQLDLLDRIGDCLSATEAKETNHRWRQNRSRSRW